MAKKDEVIEVKTESEKLDDLKQLKAEAYDCLSQIESWQLRLRQINSRIAELSPQNKK